MTMDKQKDNSKFSFLFGGEYFGYYKYKLAIEQGQRTVIFNTCKALHMIDLDHVFDSSMCVYSSFPL